MDRVKFNCPGDCSKCELLQTGQVRMEICVLDQIHQKVMRVESKLNLIIDKLEDPELVQQLAAIEDEITNDNE